MLASVSSPCRWLASDDGEHRRWCELLLIEDVQERSRSIDSLLFLAKIEESEDDRN